MSVVNGSAEWLMRATIVVAVAAVVSCVLVGVIIRLLHAMRVVDRPNARSSHAVPTVRGGGAGIAFVVAAVIGLMVKPGERVWIELLLAAFVVVAGVSFLDDFRGVRPLHRFIVHAIVAVLAVVSGLWSDSDCLHRVIVGILGWMWIVGYTNAFNFMDGINGLAGTQALITGIGTAVIGVAVDLPVMHPAILLALSVAGASLGFLPYNFPRARVFMGDVGSAPLGFLLAVLGFWIASETHWWVLIWTGLLHANFVLDTAITLVRRFRNGERLHDAHREHFYQRLVRAGQSHARVTVTQGSLQVIILFGLWWGARQGEYVRAVIAALVISIWLSYFSYAELYFRSAVHETK